MLFGQTATDSSKPLQFEVVSVKPNRSGDVQANTNVPLGPGSLYPPNGGRLSIQNMPAAALISFAYKTTGDQEQALRTQYPVWVLTDRFDIEARAAGTPTKDEMRMMVRALLTDRFHLEMHTEMRQGPIYGLVLLKASKFGPHLRQHPQDDSCSTGKAAPASTAEAAALDELGDFPAICGGLMPMQHGPGRLAKFGARNITMQFLANQLSIMGQLGRHIEDQTGLTGTFDFALEWSPDPTGPQATSTMADDPAPGAPFSEAVGTQLGLKLVSTKGPVETLVLDHVEKPSGN